MRSGYTSSTGTFSSGMTLVAAMLFAVCLLAGSIHETHHLGETGDGDCVVCLVGTGSNHALPTPEVTIAAPRSIFLPPPFSFNATLSAPRSRGHLIRAPPHSELT